MAQEAVVDTIPQIILEELEIRDRTLQQKELMVGHQMVRKAAAVVEHLVLV